MDIVAGNSASLIDRKVTDHGLINHKGQGGH